MYVAPTLFLQTPRRASRVVVYVVITKSRSFRRHGNRNAEQLGTAFEGIPGTRSLCCQLSLTSCSHPARQQCASTPLNSSCTLLSRDWLGPSSPQVSRNFNNLGNFLNTRVLKSGAATTNVSSSWSQLTMPAAARPSGGGGSRRSSGSSATGVAGDGGKGGSGSNPQPASSSSATAHAPGVGKKTTTLGRAFSPDFLSGTLGAVSRSVSPSMRSKKSLSLKGRKLVPTSAAAEKAEMSAGTRGEEGGIAAAAAAAGTGTASAASVTSPVGVRGRGGGWADARRMGWKGLSSPLPRRAGASPLGRAALEDGSDEDSDDDGGGGSGNHTNGEEDENESPITIGPAAAAAAAAADAKLGEVAAAAAAEADRLAEGTAVRSKADEHDAKLLLFGRQLGGASGGGGGGRGRASNPSGAKSSRLSKGIKRLAFPGKKGTGGGGGSAAGGPDGSFGGGAGGASAGKG